ncbi:MAG: hypothetical protein Q9159_006267 [Coniocarpon cinnabarinum]
MSSNPQDQSSLQNEQHSPSRATPSELDGIRRTVSFLDQARLPGDRRGRQPMDTESSADEHTAIVRRQKGSKRNYDAAAPASHRLPSRSSSPSSASDRPPPPSLPQVDGASDRAADEPPKLTWWKRLLDKYGTIELQNKGSVARDHLALERTFLAWLRTSLAFASIGVTVTQLFRLDQELMNTPANHPRVEKLRHIGRPLGACFLGVGILVLLIGFHRYFEGQHYVIQGKFPASRASVALVSFCAGGLVVGSLVVVATMAPAFNA